MNLKPKPKLLLVTVALLFFTYSCIKPLEPDLPQSEVTIVSLDSDPKLLDLIFTTNIKFEETSSFQLKGSANQETFSIFDNVNWDEVTKVENSEKGFTSYAAYYTDDSNSIRKNLIIMDNRRGKTAFLVKYIGDNEWFKNHSLRKDFDKFSGFIQIINRSGIVVATSRFVNGKSFFPEKGSIECNQMTTIELTYTYTYLYGGILSTDFFQWEVSEYVACPNPPEDNSVEYIERADDEESGGGGSPVPIAEPTDPDKPCTGLPVRDVQIASQSIEGSGLEGGRWGLTRSGGSQWHRGIDIKTTIGDNIYSMYGGTVVLVSDGSGDLGKYIVVRSDFNGRKIHTFYAHLANNVSVTAGQKIGSGTVLGQSGTTGNLSSALDLGVEQHVHIIIRDASIPDENVTGSDDWTPSAWGNKENPENYIPGDIDENGTLKTSDDC